MRYTNKSSLFFKFFNFYVCFVNFLLIPINCDFTHLTKAFIKYNIHLIQPYGIFLASCHPALFPFSYFRKHLPPYYFQFSALDLTIQSHCMTNFLFFCSNVLDAFFYTLRKELFF